MRRPVPSQMALMTRLMRAADDGVYDALNKKFLRTMVFAITASDDASVLLESYEFAFRYSTEADGGAVEMVLSDLSKSRRSTKSHQSKHKMNKDMSQEGGALRCYCNIVTNVPAMQDDISLYPADGRRMCKHYHDIHLYCSATLYCGCA